MAINIQEILHPSDSDSIKFEKINYNFDQILANGGGPVGPKGQKGDQGQVGSTGQKGQKGEIGATGSKGDSGATDSPWYKVELDSNNDGTNEVTILKPKIGNDLNMPVIWLGDSSFEEDIADGVLTSNARLTISKDDVYENYINLWHASDKSIVLTSSVDSGFTKFNFQNAFGSSNLEFGVSTDKITFLSNNSVFSAMGEGVLLKSLNNSNVKIETTGTGILDVDINAEFKGYLRLPSGTTGQRPNVPQVGMIRFNTETDVAEAYFANSGSPIWKELCTDCGSAIADSIGILGGDISANADGSPSNHTISISGGNINANNDGSPVSNAALNATSSTQLTVVYNQPTTLYLPYSIVPSNVDPTNSNISVDVVGLTAIVEPSSNQVKVITSSVSLGTVWTLTLTHPTDGNITEVWIINTVAAPNPTATSSGSGAGPTPTPTDSGSGSGSGPTPTPTLIVGVQPTPTPSPSPQTITPTPFSSFATPIPSATPIPPTATPGGGSGS